MKKEQEEVKKMYLYKYEELSDEYIEKNKNNYNLEMAQELQELKLNGKIGILEKQEKASPEDWEALETKIRVCTEKNYEIQVKSLKLAKKDII